MQLVSYFLFGMLDNTSKLGAVLVIASYHKGGQMSLGFSLFNILTRAPLYHLGRWLCPAGRVFDIPGVPSFYS